MQERPLRETERHNQRRPVTDEDGSSTTSDILPLTRGMNKHTPQRERTNGLLQPWMDRWACVRLQGGIVAGGRGGGIVAAMVMVRIIIILFSGGHKEMRSPSAKVASPSPRKIVET
jgi:hypothetical protein